MTPFTDKTVQTVFESYAPEIRTHLLAVRALVFSTAGEIEGCGRIVECLKWGQPAYLTENPRSGTTIRIDSIRDDPAGYGIFVHCRTRLIPVLRDIYEQDLVFEGNRAIRLSVDNPLPETIIRHCLAMALTYHLKPSRVWRTGVAGARR